MPIAYVPADDVKELVAEIVERLSLSHIDPGRVVCFRSRGSRSKRCVARCYSLLKIWQRALGLPAHYVIEVISERFDRLSDEDRVKVVIHELLHIPRSFGGGLRPHRGYVTQRRVNDYYRRFADSRRRG